MIEINNKTKSRIDLNLVKKAADRFLRVYKKNKYEVSIAFVGDRVIRKLNRNYRETDKVTDILSFPGEGDFLGEIIIDYAQIKRQAKKYGKTIKQELVFILVHGLLHLSGYNDKTEKGRREMERLGEKFILNCYDKN